MNKAFICGRLTKDVDIRYGQNSNIAVGKTTIAVNRGKGKNGQDLGADFIAVTAFGKAAENLANFKHKGDMVLIEGHITTGSYEKDGKRVFTTEVTADRIDFLTRDTNAKENETETAGVSSVPQGFSQVEDDIPF